MPDQFILFDEPYPIHRKMPYHQLMSPIDKQMPPVGVLERGANAVRAYYNAKNLRKRKEVI
jgi:hypothetical protein